MALDVNGYNSVFKAFVDFAQRKFDAGEKKAVIRATVTKPLEGRAILKLGTSRTDEVHKWTRTNDEYAVNDRTRDLFKSAIAKMFGGESKIPADVKKAMLLGDYDCGKPLTARRILAVKQAIDANGVAKARSARIKLETFDSPEVKTAALGLGYMKSELPKLARAAHFYAQAKGVSEMDAMREVGRPGSEANRLMNYGGRFLESAQNFQNGLRLISQFSDWHDGISAIRNNLDGAAPSYAGLDTLSKVNVDIRAAHPNAKLGLERFIFEDIATNPDFNLAEMDAERAFGVEHNPASRYMTVADNVSILGTIANVPPEKRRAVYAAFNAFQTLAQTGPERRQRQSVSLESIFLARVLRNLPKLESILAKTGTLTGRDVIKTCFPDIRRPGNCDAKTIEAWETDLSKEMQEYEGEDSAAVMSMLESGGATFQEAMDALDKGKSIPTVPYYSTAQYSIQEASSVAVAGLKTMNGDIDRLSTYKTGEDENKKDVFPAGSHSWKFTFPDGERLETSGARQADVPRVGEKIKNLCGEVHQKQIGTVAFLLSQSGTSVLRNQPLAKYGIVSDEHCPVDFTLSRNARTGAVTITYTSPEELPVKFSWTATVGVDGKVATTPLTVTDVTVRDLDLPAAKAMVKDAAKAMGRKLSGSELAKAANLFMGHAEGMWQKNARLFAQFVVRLPLTDASAKADRLRAADTAASIRQWRSFGFGDHRLAPFETAAKEQVQATIREFMDPATAGKFTDGIHDTMRADANRGTFILNGTVYAYKPAGELISAFKALVPDPKAQKTLSAYMNQLCFETLLMPTSHLPLSSTGTDAIHLPGAGAVVNRNMTSGLYLTSILATEGHGTTHNLELSEDGHTATLTQTISADLAAPDSNMVNKVSFGAVTLSQRIVIDLTPDVPVVTDYKLSQTLS